MQKYSSKNTSINTISKIYKQYNFKENSIILDYGCGKYDTSIEFMKNKNCIVLPYDKYNRDENTNKNSLEISKQNLDYIVCSNVLNVIYEKHIIEDILKHIFNLSNKDTIILFSIYEGNKSGIGQETSKGYQRNEKLNSYLPLLEKYFNVKRLKQIYICTKKEI